MREACGRNWTGSAESLWLLGSVCLLASLTSGRVSPGVLPRVALTVLFLLWPAGSDAIIRQHKAACLRITALLACKDLLWIGTSAGVVLTLSLSANAASLKTQPLPAGLSQGHTGHVRFLTSIELPEGFDVLFPLPRDPGGLGQEWQPQGRSPAAAPPDLSLALSVIAGSRVLLRV